MFTIIIPFAEKNATVWHPTSKTGPFSVLSRGAFACAEDAHAWAKANIAGHKYFVKEMS